MKKMMKNSLCLLLALVLALQLGGLAMAEGDQITGDEALVYELRVPAVQPEGSEAQGPEADSRVVSADEEATLFDAKPYSILIGEDQKEETQDSETVPEKKAKVLTRGIGEASLKDLMAEDLHITPPEGFFVSALYLRGDALGADAKLVSLPASAKAGSPALDLSKGSFTALEENKDDPDAGTKTVFNRKLLSSLSTAETKVYTLVVVLSPIDKEKELTVSYPDLTDANQTGKAGDSFTAPEAPTAPEGSRFTGWQLSYPNGSTLSLKPGDSFSPYTDCTVKAQFITVVTVSANDLSAQAGQTLQDLYFGFTPESYLDYSIENVRFQVQDAEGNYLSGETVVQAGSYSVTVNLDEALLKDSEGNSPAPPLPSPVRSPLRNPLRSPAPSLLRSLLRNPQSRS